MRPPSTDKYYWRLWVQIRRHYEQLNFLISNGDILPHLEDRLEDKLKAINDLLKSALKEAQK